MAKRTATVDDHRIEIWSSEWNGLEEVRYDNRLVSRKRSFRELTNHDFAVRDGRWGSGWQASCSACGSSDGG
jgi:hypothetical protein